jgi:hypothetical protein
MVVLIRNTLAKIYHSFIISLAFLCRQYFHHKIKKKKLIRIVFLVSENQKWNCSSLYDEFRDSDIFVPKIAVTKLERSSLEVHKENLRFFKDRNYTVVDAYDAHKNKGISLRKLNADIIFAQQPGGLIKNQGLISLALAGLICYIPYGLMVANNNKNHYGLVFNKILWKYFAPNNLIKELYLKTSKWTRDEKVVVTGHPKLDDFRLKKNTKNDLDVIKNDGKKVVIFAPHHSVERRSSLQYATFTWNGNQMLEYARLNPNIYFIFKPHPRLRYSLISSGLMESVEVEKYYDNWSRLDNSQVYDAGEYFDLFNCSDVMITDSGSFLAEYLLTERPIILPINPKSKGYNKFGAELVKSYYQVNDFNQLKTTLDSLLNGSDPLKANRVALIEKYFDTGRSAENIVEYLTDSISSP